MSSTTAQHARHYSWRHRLLRHLRLLTSAHFSTRTRCSTACGMFLSQPVYWSDWMTFSSAAASLTSRSCARCHHSRHSETLLPGSLVIEVVTQRQQLVVQLEVAIRYIVRVRCNAGTRGNRAGGWLRSCCNRLLVIEVELHGRPVRREPAVRREVQVPQEQSEVACRRRLDTNVRPLSCTAHVRGGGSPTTTSTTSGTAYAAAPAQRGGRTSMAAARAARGTNHSRDAAAACARGVSP